MRAKRSELFNVQKQARNAGFEMDSIDAGYIVLAGQVLADRNATEQQRGAARRVLEAWQQSLAKANYVVTFCIYQLPDDDEADEITEDIDRSKLSPEDHTLIDLPAMTAEEWSKRTDGFGHGLPEYCEANLRKRALLAKAFGRRSAP